MKIAYAALAATVLLASGAQADTVYNTSLPNVTGAYGAGVATTTTTASGTTTTVVGPGGGANRAGATPVFNRWLQENVGGNASVGITTQYARSGNGSLAFTALTPSDSKADLEYYFSPVALSSVTSMSYDWYRASTSTTEARQVPALRLLLTNGTSFSNLIFEPVYNGLGSSPAPTDSWQTSLISGSTFLWSSNNNLAGSAGCPSCYTTSLSAWQDLNPTWSVYGLSTGVGSGWTGTFSGAVDNIAFNSRTLSLTANFEVAATGDVPEPASWAMMVAGFGLLGAALRRRSRAAAHA